VFFSHEIDEKKRSSLGEDFFLLGFVFLGVFWWFLGWFIGLFSS
jgi:hypothetical protein